MMCIVEVVEDATHLLYIPMPGIPPMPPIGGALAIAPPSAGLSTIIDSDVVRRPATEAASTIPVRVTLVGSMMPAAIISVKTPFCASKPCSTAVPSLISSPTITAPSSPAFEAIVDNGARRAFMTISTPICWSMFLAAFFLTASNLVEQCNRAFPPPGTIPSSTAARVAFNASTTRSFFSPTSTSEAPPTRMTATPPASFANRSWSFSRS
mmetsp:Transcript_16921/g.39083  ORF Transcript_16921/g.39083 Transcript_16921/m.39083 type:complete len:210 (+) Transcript_16921:85-714(+)